MTRVHTPQTRLRRTLFRAPILLYRLGLGGLLGSRFTLLTHTGRSSGRPRQVVLEVVGRHQASGGYLVASGFGLVALTLGDGAAATTAGRPGPAG